MNARSFTGECHHGNFVAKYMQTGTYKLCKPCRCCDAASPSEAGCAQALFVGLLFACRDGVAEVA